MCTHGEAVVSQPQMMQSADAVTHPLDTTAIMRLIMQLIGPGHFLFVSSISKRWQQAYRRAWKRARNSRQKRVDRHATIFAAALASPSRVGQAREFGLDLQKSRVRFLAGRLCDMATLQDLCSASVPLNDPDVLPGAVVSNSLVKVQYLLPHHTELPDGICTWAARYSSVEVMTALIHAGLKITEANMIACTFENASPALLQLLFDQVGLQPSEYQKSLVDKISESAGRLDMLQWAASVGFPVTSRAAEHFALLSKDAVAALTWMQEEAGLRLGKNVLFYAAGSGNLATFRYCMLQGLEVFPGVCNAAAGGASTDILDWLVEHGYCELHAGLCTSAAHAGRLGNLQYLRSIGCPWDLLEVVTQLATSICGLRDRSALR